MRTTVDLPDPLLRRLKSKAALEGTTLKAVVLDLVERGLDMPTVAPRTASRSKLPSICAGQALPLQNPSNSSLFELLDEA